MVKTPPDKLHISKGGLWNEEEDENMLKCAPKQHGITGHRRSGKSSRERWSSNHKADPKGKSFTPQEEELVIQLHAAIGSRWPIIAQQLPGRTDNDVKILWNSKLRKKLSAMGIDPVTHKPFSQILADYGNIGAFPKARTRFSSLSRDLKNAVVFKPSEQKQAQATNLHDNYTLPHAKSEPMSLDLYSQLQAANFAAESMNQEGNIMQRDQNNSNDDDQEISSFSWSDFLLEDAFDDHDDGKETNVGMDIAEGKGGSVEERKVSSFEGACSSTSNSSSFVEAMIETQDETFSEFSGFCDQQFYF